MVRKTKITEEEFDEDGNLTRRTVTEEEEDEPQKFVPYTPTPNPIVVPTKVYPTTEPWRYPTTTPYHPTWVVTTTNTNDIPRQYLTFNEHGQIIGFSNAEYDTPSAPPKKDEDDGDEGLTPAKV